MLKNTRSGYGLVAIALHWISAVGIVWLLIQGWGIESASGQEAHIAAIRYHNALGMLFIVFFAARLVSSATQPRPDALGSSAGLNHLARLVHILLLLCIAILIVTGPLTAWSFGNPISVFGWFSIPGPFSAPNMAVHTASERIHGITQWALTALLGLHILGAIWHVAIDRDGTLMRMLRPNKEA